MRAVRLGFGILLALSLAVRPTGAQVSPTPDVVGEWAPAVTFPFFPVHVHMLPTGNVLLWGIPGDNPILWDPATPSTWVSASLPGFNMFCSGHSYLADGRLLVTGGHIENNVGLPNASTYDPVNNSWTRMPDMNAGRWYPTNTTLANGDVLVTSGDIINGSVNTLPQVFQASSGTWRDLTTAELGLPLYPNLHLSPNGKVFLSGPSASTRYLETSGTGSWTDVAAHRFGGYRSYGSSVMYAPGKILVMGGADPPTNTAEVIDLNAATPVWRLVAPMTYARRQLNATLLADGKVLVTGGTSGAGFDNAGAAVYAAELWDPATETWTLMASAQVPRLYHSATVLLPDGRVLSAGGNGYPQAELYSPPYLFNGARPTITTAPNAVTYGETFFVSTPDAAAITRVTWVRLSSTTHAFNMDQRINDLTFAPAQGGLDVTAPAAQTTAPPGHYLLFLLNGSGVPSVASIVRMSDDVAPPPGVTVDITATAETATEAGLTTGTLTVSRTGAATSALTVNYTVSGTAEPGSDYQALTGSVTIPAEQASATIVVTPIDDTLVEGDETVIVTLAANAAYTIGTSGSATVTIQSDDVAPPPGEIIVDITPTAETATEAGLTTGTLTVSRTGAATSALTVNYTVGGTAGPGSDYQALTGSVTIPAEQASATIVVTPINDTAVEPNETVVVSLSPDGAYLVGTPGSATVTIVSDDVPPPDKELVIEGLTLSAGSVAAGSRVTASYLVANRGTVTVTETYTDKLHLSTDATLDAGDVLLGTSHGHTADLAPNATHAHSQAVTVPAGTAARSYFLVVQADSLAAVIETNEGNNVTAVALAVTPALQTGLRSPTANAPNSGGDGNGFESSPQNAHANDTLNAVDNNSGRDSSTSCTSSSKDKHRFYNYGLTFPAGVSIRGIQVRLDAKVDSTSGSPKMCVQLSWNGGSTWTSTKSTPTLGTSMGTFTLGSPTDTWGRSWTTGNFSDANFRVRVINVSSSTSRDFSLDWVAVSVHYQ